MSRAQRLLDLIQALRRHRRAAPGAVLAEELAVSLRTIYRDIDTLKAQGAHIDGEAGVGYVLRPGFMLPPLMFSEEEIEALVLGSRWVATENSARWPSERLDVRPEDDHGLGQSVGFHPQQEVFSVQFRVLEALSHLAKRCNAPADIEAERVGYEGVS